MNTLFPLTTDLAHSQHTYKYFPCADVKSTSTFPHERSSPYTETDNLIIYFHCSNLKQMTNTLGFTYNQNEVQQQLMDGWCGDACGLNMSVSCMITNLNDLSFRDIRSTMHFLKVCPCLMPTSPSCVTPQTRI
jgi:hypothetical protein